MKKFINRFLQISKRILSTSSNVSDQCINTKRSFKARGKYLFPTIIIGTILYENYERFFSLLGMSGSRLKKKIDTWKGKETLDKTIDLNLTDMNLLNEEEYFIKITQKESEKHEKAVSPTKTEIPPEDHLKKSDVIESLKAAEEIKFILNKEIEGNKKLLTLDLIEKEELLDTYINEKSNLLNQIKAERQNHKKIINRLKEKVSAEEFSNLEKILQVLNEEKLISDQLTKINLVLPQGENYKSLNECIENLNKLTNDYNKVNQNLNNLGNEIKNINEKINTFSRIENDYKAKFNLILSENNLIYESLKEIEAKANTSNQNLPVSKQTETSNLQISPSFAISNKLFDLIEILYNNMIQTNNRKNLEQFNTLYSNFKHGLIKVLEERQDEFGLEILKNFISPDNIIVSHIEIENAFEAIKGDLLYHVFITHFESGNETLKIVGPYLSLLAYASSRRYLHKYDPYLHKIEENDSQDRQLLKALNFLADNIKYRKYPEAYKNLQYFKHQEKLISDLKKKLEMVTKEAVAIEILKNHLI